MSLFGTIQNIRKLNSYKDISCNRMEVFFQFYLWDQAHVTIVWNTRETGDMYHQYKEKNVFQVHFKSKKNRIVTYMIKKK